MSAFNLHILHPRRSIATWAILARLFELEAKQATDPAARREAELQARTAHNWIAWQEGRSA